MAQVKTVILRHCGSGADHFDLIIGQGRRCPTLRIEPHGRLLHLAWAAPHRRWYLSYAGAIAGGRGRVSRVWAGPAQWSRSRLGLAGLVLPLTRKSIVPSVAWRKLLAA